MRRLELLSTEVRDSTDTRDINSISIYELMRYFNDGQKAIQKIIFTANPDTDMFVSQTLYTPASEQVAYDLPYDIYSYSAVSALHSIKDNKIVQTLKKGAYREKDALWGYAIVDKKFVLSSSPSTSTISGLLLNYTRKLPIMSYRIAQITAVDALTGVVTVDAGTIISDLTFTDRYDNYSIVNSIGTQKAIRLNLVSAVGTAFTFTGELEADANLGLDGAEIGDWIVCGDSGTSHSSLPDECEPFLLSYVQRRVLAKLSSSEIQIEAIFTEQERQDIEDLFADTTKDIVYPVTSDTDYLGY